MSKSIDQKVVEMRFDNHQFERNVQTSMATLDRLKKSLNMEGAAKGFENVSSAAKNCDVSLLGKAVESVQLKFSALEVMAVTALANITNSAVNSGKRIASAFTIEPIKSGFEEYETQINAVQTILANTSSKGTTLDQVNNALDELNHYADMTIYNFTEMTRNIGTFTAAGVDLDTSVSAIKGIANLAAVSGSNSSQASTAMYQLSQALAAGRVNLQDWNSVVNAGMGGQVFQDALKDTARVHGIAIDQMIQDEGSFRETLQKGWLTSEVLTETLSKFTGDLNENQLRTMGYTDQQIQSILKMGQTANDAATKVKTFTQLFDTLKEAAQSGWTQSWKLIVGDFEEAKELLTSVSDTFSEMINASAEARNNMLQEWKELGGRTMLIESAKNVFEGLLSVVRPIKEAFRDIFPAMTGKRLAEITEKVRDLTAKFKIGEETSKNLRNTFRGVFAVFDIVGQAIKAVVGGIADLIGFFLPAGNGILGLTGKFGEYLSKLNEIIKKTNVFQIVIKTIITVIKTGVGAAFTIINGAFTLLKKFVAFLKEKIEFPGFELFHTLLERIHARLSQVGDAAGNMRATVVNVFQSMGEALSNSKIFSVLEKLWGLLKTIASTVGKAFGALGGKLLDKLGNADFSGFFDVLAGASIGAIALGINRFLKNLTEPLEGLKGLLKGVTGILDGVCGCFEAYQTNLKAGTLLKIASAIAILTASIVVISLIDSDKLFSSLSAITILFGNLVGAMAIFNKISPYYKGVLKSSVVMISMSFAILILASALKKLSSLSFTDIIKGVGGVTALTAVIVAAAKVMNSGKTTVFKGAVQILMFSLVVKILASACSDLSQLSLKELAKGLTGVGILLAEISLFLNNTNFSGKSILTATGIVILSGAIKILASACADFAEMSVKEIGKGLVSIAILLGEITAFTKLTGDSKRMISTSICLIAIGAAMRIFASVVTELGGLSLTQIAKGLSAMGIALAEIILALKFMPNNMVGMGVGLIAVGAALEILTNILTKLGNLSGKQIAKGLIALGGALVELSVGLNLLKGTLSGSAALVVASAAIAVLTPALSILGAMSLQSIVKGLIAIAGAFAVFGAAGAILGPLIPAILGLSAAFAIIGIGVAAIGAGLLAAGAGLSALAIGFTALVGAGVAGATAIVSSLTIIISGIADLIPTIIGKLGEGIIEFAKAIANGAPEIAKAVKALVLSTIDVLIECVPKLVDCVLKIVTEVLQALVKYTPQIVDAIFQFLVVLLDGISRNLPALIQAAVDVIMAFFTGLFDAFAGMDTDVLLKGLAGIGILSGIMLALGAVATLVPGAMIGVLGMGAVIAELALVLAAIGGLQQIPGLSWLIGEGGKLLGAIGNAIGSFIGGIVGGILEGVTSSFPKIGADLSDFMINIQPFIDGATKIDASTLDGVKALAEVILLLTAADVLEGLTSWFTGGSSLTKFAEELVPFGTAMRDFSKEIAGMDGNAVANAATAGKTLAEMAATLPNSGGVVGFFAGENDLDTFSEKIVPFGTAMKAFAAEVAGLNPDVVTNAATAGKALAEMATTIPNSGGVVGFFAGENDLDTFGEKLAPFGKTLKDFSVAVSGMDGKAVEQAAIAGKMMAEMATTIPNSGGVVGFFAGENDLDTFGEKLVPFGKALKAFAIEVQGLVVEDVEKAATAGKMMVELEETIPSSGGVLGFFVGNNDIDTFGEKLPPFGRALKEFAIAVQGVVVEDVEHAANAGMMLSELQKALPDTGGIVSWFSGNKDLADFGSKLKSFGQGLGDFYTCISIINPDQLSKVISEINRLVDLAKGIETLDSGKLSGFSKALTDLGKSGIDGFISAFTGAVKRVQDTATDMLNKFINAAVAKQKDLTDTFTRLVDSVISILNLRSVDFTSAGEKSMTSFIIGVKSQVQTCQANFTILLDDILAHIRNRSTEFTTVGEGCMVKLIAGIRGQETNTKQIFVNLISAGLTAIKNKYVEFESVGKECVTNLISGIRGKTNETKQVFVSGLETSVRAVRDFYKEFYSAGNYLVEGFVEGISKNTYKAEAKSKAMAKAAANAAKKELDEHSPSKVFYQIGAYAGQGLVNAFGDYESKTWSAGEGVAKSAMDGLRQTLSDMHDLVIHDVDIQPTIRPVLDLSGVKAEAKNLDAMFSREQAMAIGGSMRRREQESFYQNGSTPSGSPGNSYQFIQNNYSPKALSRLEIYRQTKNQFSAMREAVSRV